MNSSFLMFTVSVAAIFAAVWFLVPVETAEELRRDTDEAIVSCRGLGGEPLLKYDYHSETFYLTECKLTR